MKYSKLKNRIEGFLLLLAVTGISCQEDELCSKELKVYANVGAENCLELNVVHTPIDVRGELNLEFPVTTTRELETNMTVRFEVDESMVAVYNELNGTNYLLVPPTSYDIGNGEICIERGKAISTDLEVKLVKADRLIEKGGYILPLRIAEVSGKDKGLEISTNLNVVYVIVNILELTMETPAILAGEIADRNGWTDQYENGTTLKGTLLDGNVSNGIRSYSKPVPFIIDMQSSIELKGLRLTPYYSPSAYLTSKAEVSFSENGETYERIGIVDLPNVGGTKTDPKFQYISFFIPVRAQYIKMDMIGRYGSYYAISEFNAIK